MKRKIFSLTFLIFFLDQLFKHIIASKLVLQEVFYVIPNFFYITYVKNTGGAWSVFSSIPYGLIIMNILFLGLFIWYIDKKEKFNLTEILYFGLILGGVLGNLMDRIFLNGVIDYIGIQFGSYHYPIFNFADISIVVGMVLIITEILKGEIHENRSRKQ